MNAVFVKVSLEGHRLALMKRNGVYGDQCLVDVFWTAHNPFSPIWADFIQPFILNKLFVFSIVRMFVLKSVDFQPLKPSLSFFYNEIHDLLSKVMNIQFINASETELNRTDSCTNRKWLIKCVNNIFHTAKSSNRTARTSVSSLNMLFELLIQRTQTQTVWSGCIDDNDDDGKQAGRQAVSSHSISVLKGIRTTKMWWFVRETLN